MTVARRRVLVLDDSALVLDLVREALEAEGIDVACASDLATFDRLRQTTPAPDLLLVDIQMPEAFGDDIAAMLRGAYGTKATILLYSSLDDAELARRAAEAGVDGWVSKGAGLPVLVSRVQAALQGGP